MNDERRREAILQDLDKYLSRPKLQDDEITVKMVMDRWNKSERVARHELDRLVREGSYAKRQVFVDGYWCNAYRPVQS